MKNSHSPFKAELSGEAGQLQQEASKGKCGCTSRFIFFGTVAAIALVRSLVFVTHELAVCSWQLEWRAAMREWSCLAAQLAGSLFLAQAVSLQELVSHPYQFPKYLLQIKT